MRPALVFSDAMAAPALAELRSPDLHFRIGAVAWARCPGASQLEAEQIVDAGSLDGSPRVRTEAVSSMRWVRLPATLERLCADPDSSVAGYARVLRKRWAQSITWRRFRRRNFSIHTFEGARYIWHMSAYREAVLFADGPALANLELDLVADGEHAIVGLDFEAVQAIVASQDPASLRPSQRLWLTILHLDHRDAVIDWLGREIVARTPPDDLRAIVLPEAQRTELRGELEYLLTSGRLARPGPQLCLQDALRDPRWLRAVSDLAERGST